MIRQDVIRQIVQREQQQQTLHEDAVQHEDVRLYEAACESFGTWETALHYAGVTQRRIRQSTPEQVLQKIRRRCVQRCSLASHRVIQRDSQLYFAALRHFGGWVDALRAAGIDPANVFCARPANKQQVIEGILKRHQLGLALERNRVFLEHRMLVIAAIGQFGCWGNALAAAGLEPVRRGGQRTTNT